MGSRMSGDLLAAGTWSGATTDPARSGVRGEGRLLAGSPAEAVEGCGPPCSPYPPPTCHERSVWRGMASPIRVLAIFCDDTTTGRPGDAVIGELWPKSASYRYSDTTVSGTATGREGRVWW